MYRLPAIEEEFVSVHHQQDAASQAARFYLNHPLGDLDAEPVARLIGNRVLLFRQDSGLMQSKGGIFTRDIYGHGSMLYKVMAVGPGTWTKQYDKSNKFKWVYITPGVDRGDIVVSNHWNDASTQTGWTQPHNLDDAGGNGRVIVDARFILLSWKPQTKTQ